jgi:hypothetical protein
MRADNFALSEQTKQLRDKEQREITDQAYAEALRLVGAHRHYLDLLANALLEEETLERDQIDVLLKGLEPESDASGKIGVALPQESDTSSSENGAALPQASDTTPSENGHKLDPVLRSDPFTETGDKT